MLDSQLDQLRDAGCSSRNIYREKVIGTRPGQHLVLLAAHDAAISRPP
jgi:hypothetical protein